MEQLSETQLENLKKTSSARLTSRLLCAGFSEEILDKMSRHELMENWAKCIVEGKETAGLATGSKTVGYDPELEKMRLEFEMRKHEATLKLEQDKLALEAKRLEVNEKIELAKLEQQSREKGTVVAKLKTFGDALKHSLTHQPDAAVDIIAYFRHVDAVFERLGKPAEYRSDLIVPYLVNARPLSLA